jgi:hypothetical protein
MVRSPTLILDQAGCHGAKQLRIPANISLLLLPPRAAELNSQENIWQFTRQNWLSNRIFKSFDDIVDHCCYAWNTLIDQPWKIRVTRLGGRKHIACYQSFEPLVLSGFAYAKASTTRGPGARCARCTAVRYSA